MLDFKVTPEELAKEHYEICPAVYKDIDLSIAPERYRCEISPHSRLHGKIKPSQNAVITDSANLDMLRQLCMSGDPIADAYTATWKEIGFQKARAMVDQALDDGVDSIPSASAEMITFFKEVEKVPEWVDWEKVDEFGELFGPFFASFGTTGLKAGFLSTFINSYQGLPMVLTGTLKNNDKTPQRIKETTGALSHLAIPNGLRPGGESYKTTIKIRLMHSMVRASLLKHPEWDVAVYGIPIPQIDMYSTALKAATFTKLLKQVTPGTKPYTEADNCAPRYYAYLMGIDPRIPQNTLEEVSNIELLMKVTLRHRVEPWALELSESTLGANLQLGDSAYDRLISKADTRFSSLLLRFLYGKKVSEELRIKSGPMDYLWMLLALTPVIGMILKFILLSLMPNGRAKVRALYANTIRRNLGLIKPEYETNPEGYKQTA